MKGPVSMSDRVDKILDEDGLEIPVFGPDPSINAQLQWLMDKQVEWQEQVDRYLEEIGEIVIEYQ